MAPELDVERPAPDAVARWAKAEVRYRHASWFGRPAIVLTRRFGDHPVLLTAPHAGHQLRNQWPKPADPNTGGLAEVLAEVTGSACVTVCGFQQEDPNWDVEVGPFKRAMRELLPRHPFNIDLHGMRRERGLDICIGPGPAPDAETLRYIEDIRRLAAAAGFSVAIGAPFAARRPGTVTSFAQSSGYRGVQIELSARLTDVEEAPELAAALFAWLQEVVRRAPSQAGRLN